MMAKLLGPERDHGGTELISWRTGEAGQVRFEEATPTLEVNKSTSPSLTD
jgi:hypothetical protein